MRDNLEVIVSQRTAELKSANLQLLNEIAERRRIQGDLELLSLALQKTATSAAIVDASKDKVRKHPHLSCFNTTVVSAWKVKWINDSLSRATGLQKDSAIGANLLDLIVERDGNHVSQIIRLEQDVEMFSSIMRRSSGAIVPTRY